MTHKRTVYALFLILFALILMSCTTPTQTPALPNVVPTQPPTPQTVPLTDGVTIILPWQGQDTSVKLLSKGAEGSPGGSSNDKVVYIRGLVDFEVVDKSGKLVPKFDPAITIIAKYTGQDIEKAGDAKNLVLGFYDVGSKAWLPISDGKTVLGDDDTVKVDTVEWGDKWACMCSKPDTAPAP